MITFFLSHDLRMTRTVLFSLLSLSGNPDLRSLLIHLVKRFSQNKNKYCSDIFWLVILGHMDTQWVVLSEAVGKAFSDWS